jgi:stage II sporulation SpoAA-like protein
VGRGGAGQTLMVKAIVGGEVSHRDGVFYNRPGVAIVKWDSACKAAHIEWQGWANPAEFAAANDAIIVALRQRGGSRALGDCREMRVIKQSDQDWVNRDWIPRILAAGLRRMALVIPKSGLALMNVQEIMSRVPGTKLDVAYFATVEEARDWLSRPHTVTPTGLPTIP